jgi:hypothetical protein
MALVLADRVQVTTSTTGTGTLTLGSVVTGFQDFTVIGDGNTTYYAITNSTAWEVGVGTYTASGTTLARTTILSNSNGNTSPITLSGDSNVFVTYPAVAASDAALPTQTSNAGKYLQTDGTDATWEVAGDLLAANNLSDLASATTARANLGLVIGTDVQAEVSGAVLTAVTVDAADKVLVQDASDSSNLKTVTAQSIADLAGGMPVGTIIDFAGTAPPTGFLTCPITLTNISRATYADLFTAIGTTWGVGNGSTTFGLPWFAADYASVQANANVGTATTGNNKAHTHTYTQRAQGIPPGSGFSGAASSSTPSTTNTGSSGGSANLAAGVRVLKCIKY